MRGSPATPDAYVKALLDANPNLLIPHYLLHSWLYYEADRPLISDALFDTLCQRLQAQWDGLVHPHKEVIDKECLSAGTGFYLSGRYPSIVPHAATRLSLMFQPKRGRKT